MADCSVKESLRLIEDLKFFLATAPANWQENQVIRRYYLNHDEGFVSCVFWNNLYFVTGTDIVRCIVYKFEHFGRKIIDRKKFEEGIFSDLRNLKCGTDAILEPPRLDFLEFLFKNLCLRTQKKQKVFFWFNVPHDKLMADALERDLKKEALDQNPTTIAYREPAVSFNYDDKSPLYTQLIEHMDKQQKFSKMDNDNNIEEHSNIHEQQDPINKITEVPEEEEDSDDRLDEQLDKANATIKQKGYDFLTQQTPVQYKNTEYEDDFPLDYFDTQAQNGGAESDEYFNVDVGGVVGGGGNPTGNYEEQYDTYIDPSIFVAPTANPLVFNNEYLIEQTQPLKSAKYPPAISFSQAIAGGKLASSKEEYFPGSQPQSAKYTQFQRSLAPQQPLQKFAGSQQLSIPQAPQLLPQLQLQQQQQQAHFWNEPSNVFPQQQYYNGETGYLPFQQQQQQVESEYWTYADQQAQLQQQQQFAQQYLQPILTNGNYYVPGIESEPYNSIYQPVNSSMVVHHPVSAGGMHAAGEFPINRAPSRHHPTNNKLMNAKRQGPLPQRNFSGGGGVSKPESTKRHTQPYANLQEVVANKATKVTKKEDDEEQLLHSVSKKTSFIPTPESSVSQVETHAANPAQSE